MKHVVVLVLLLTANLACAAAAKLPVSNENKWKSECGSCHLAYPPQLMSAENWQGVMGSLDKHFGSNAALDTNIRKDVLGFLMRNAGSGELYSSASFRISDTPWFKREHHVIAAAEWAKKNHSHCESCHGKSVLGS